MTFAYIEESPFRPGEYVGLGEDDVAFRIYRDASSSTSWAIERDMLAPRPPRVISAMLLSDFSVKLAAAKSAQRLCAPAT